MGVSSLGGEWVEQPSSGSTTREGENAKEGRRKTQRESSYYRQGQAEVNSEAAVDAGTCCHCYRTSDETEIRREEHEKAPLEAVERGLK